MYALPSVGGPAVPGQAALSNRAHQSTARSARQSCAGGDMLASFRRASVDKSMTRRLPSRGARTRRLPVEECGTLAVCSRRTRESQG